MRLVESETPGPEAADAITPPRPERRRVSVSLLFSLSVLAGTVGAIYALVPGPDARGRQVTRELRARAVAFHRAAGPYAVTAPSRPELIAWSIGALGAGGETAPWPAQPREPSPAGGAESVEVVGVASFAIAGQAATAARFRLGEDVVTFAIRRADDRDDRPPDAVDERVLGDLVVVSWRCGPWACAVVGPAATSPQWRIRAGVPHTSRGSLPRESSPAPSPEPSPKPSPENTR